MRKIILILGFVAHSAALMAGVPVTCEGNNFTYLTNFNKTSDYTAVAEFIASGYFGTVHCGLSHTDAVEMACGGRVSNSEGRLPDKWVRFRLHRKINNHAPQIALLEVAELNQIGTINEVVPMVCQ